MNVTPYSNHLNIPWIQTFSDQYSGT